jgi:hypothetical protein
MTTPVSLIVLQNMGCNQMTVRSVIVVKWDHQLGSSS